VSPRKWGVSINIFISDIKKSFCHFFLFFYFFIIIIFFNQFG